MLRRVEKGPSKGPARPEGVGGHLPLGEGLRPGLGGNPAQPAVAVAG